MSVMESQSSPGSSVPWAADPKIWKLRVRIRRLDDRDSRYAHQIKSPQAQLNRSGQGDASKRKTRPETEHGHSSDSVFQSDRDSSPGSSAFIEAFITNTPRRRGNIARSPEKMLIDQDPKLLKVAVKVVKLQMDEAKDFFQPGQRRIDKTRRRSDSDSDNNDTGSDPEWETEARVKTSQQKRRSGRSKGSTARRPRTSGRRRKVSYLPGEPEYPDVVGFDRDLTAKRVVGVLENHRSPDQYFYVVEFADPQPEEPDHVSQEIVPKSIMHTNSPTKSALTTAFYLTRLNWSGKITSPDIDALERGLQREQERLQEANTSAGGAGQGQEESMEIMESQGTNDSPHNNSHNAQTMELAAETQENVDFEDCHSNLSTDEGNADEPPTHEDGFRDHDLHDEYYECEYETVEIP